MIGQYRIKYTEDKNRIGTVIVMRAANRDMGIVMKLNIRTVLLIVGLIGLINLLIGCNGTAVPTETPTLDLPSASTAEPTATAAAEVEDAPTNTAQSPTSPPATETTSPTAVPHTATPTTVAFSQTNYAVIFVEENDVLNVRSGPGVDFGIVGTLPPDANDVQITGSGQLVSGSTWVPVQRGGLAGWVNSRFLTQFVADASFCSDTAVLQLLDRLKTAVVNQDDALFAQLIHPERGLRARFLWHQTEHRLDNIGFLSDPTSYDWGVETGSGFAIIGTPAQILLPHLQADFLGATESACNEILNGGSAGLIVLPDSHASINFYSFYRPGTEEYANLNWGSWVVGVEQWQGQYYISTLVHYQWEI